MRKKLAGLMLAGSLLVGATPFVGVAHANTPTNNTDPVLCFVAAQSIITEALHDYRTGNLSISDLRGILVGTASFLGDCLTP